MFIYFEKKCRHNKIFIIHKMEGEYPKKKIFTWDTDTIMAQLS